MNETRRDQFCWAESEMERYATGYTAICSGLHLYPGGISVDLPIPEIWLDRN